MIIRIGSYQGPVLEGDPDRSTERAIKLLQEASETGLHFLCLPECYLTGYAAESVRGHSLTLDSNEIRAIVAASAASDVVLLVGLAEQSANGIYNSQLVVHRGRILGVAHKTMLTQGYDDTLFVSDLSLPVFSAHGVTFGVAICHSTSFVEPALALRWRGARLLFTPHFNDLPPGVSDGPTAGHSMWDHRRMVLNNQAALATLLKMVVVRSNVVRVSPDGLGSGDSGIWDMDGNVVASGTPFTEQIVVAEFDRAVFEQEHWIDRREVPAELLDMIATAAHEYPR